MKRATGHRVENVPYVPYVPRIGPEKAENGQAGGYIGHIGHIPRGRYGRRKAMDFDVGDLLGNLFGGAVPTMIVATAQPVAVPEAVELPTPAVDAECGRRWSRCPTSIACPCPATRARCAAVRRSGPTYSGGSGAECANVQPSTRRLQWADRAARLRQQAQRQKPAPRIAPGCVAGGIGSILWTSAASGPLQSQLRGLCGA